MFSIIGNFSRFPECTSPALEPDYGKLYRYIAAVMDESLSMPTLTPLGECCMSLCKFLLCLAELHITLVSLSPHWLTGRKTTIYLLTAELPMTSWEFVLPLGEVCMSSYKCALPFGEFSPLGPRPAAALSLQNPLRREVTV